MKAIFFIAFLVMIAELGCLLRSTALALKYGKLPVFLGTLIGTAVAAALGIYFAETIKYYVPEKTISIIAGTIFVCFGVWLLFGHPWHSHHH